MPSLSRDPSVSSLGPQTPLMTLYEERYRPARQPGDPHAGGCEVFRTDIKNFARPRQFREWLEQTTAATRKQPPPLLYSKFLRAQARGYQASWTPTIADLCDENLEEAMSFLVQMGRSLATANKFRRHIRALWTFAREEGYTSQASKSRKYREPRKDPIALLPPEFDALIAAAERQKALVGGVPAGQWYAGALLFIYATGLRIEAAMETPTANLDLERGEVLVPFHVQKQQQDQRLDLFPSVVERLAAWRLQERGVRTVLGDWPYSIAVFRKMFRRLQVEAGLFARERDVPRTHGFHILRKTLASRIYQVAGIDAARERLGHSSVTVTWRYIDPRYKKDQRVRDLLPDPTPSPPGEPAALKLFTGEAS